MRPLIQGILLAAVAAGVVVFIAMTARGAEQPGGEKVPVLVELFTSEGCSSCPPADHLLTELEERQPVSGIEVIALGQHVDYWDGLGWRDRFSSAQFTDRQRGYSRNFGGEGVYTPQMVVDGYDEFVGSDAREARQSIERAAKRAKAAVRLDSAGTGQGLSSSWTIRVENLPPKSSARADVYLAVTEGGIASQVARGENRGRLLQHTSVVRVLKKIGSVDAHRSPVFEKQSELALDPAWMRKNLRLVAFVQESPSGHVLGAVSRRITSE